MPSKFHISGYAFLLVVSLLSVRAHGEEQATMASTNFANPTNDSFYSTNVAHREQKRLETGPREFGIFSPLRPQAPASFGNGQTGPMPPMMPRPVITAPQEESDNSKKGWIFAKPEDATAESIFKVKNFGSVEKEKAKKEQSAFSKFVANDSNYLIDKSKLQTDPRTAKKEAEEKRTAEARSSQDVFSSNGSRENRDFTSRDSSRNNPFESRTDSLNTRSSIFGEYFGGNRMAEERWAEQSMARRNEFQQLFESRPSASENKSLIPSAPTVATGSSDFNRPGSAGFSELWKSEGGASFGSRSSLSEANARQIGVGASSSITAPSATRPQYQQPAVLPFPRRPGELFK